MENLGRMLCVMTRYKRTAIYLFVVSLAIAAVAIFDAMDADAATHGRVSFKVGHAPVSRTIDAGAGDSATLIRLYVNGHQVEAGEEQGCNVYFHKAWLTVRAHSCGDSPLIKLRAVNTGKAKRVTFTWQNMGQADSGSQRSGA